MPIEPDEELLEMFQSVTGEQPSIVSDYDFRLYAYEFQERPGYFTIRDNTYEHRVSISMDVTGAIPYDTYTFTYIATHAYNSRLGTSLDAYVDIEGIHVRTAISVPRSEMNNDRLAVCLEALDYSVDLTLEDLPRWGDPIDEPPASAWLIMGDENSFMNDEDLNSLITERLGEGICGSWTASKNTRHGDLLLFYYMSPRKAVHFVARAVGDAFFESDSNVEGAGHSVSDSQWWVRHTPPIRIDPISFKDIQSALGGHLMLKGQSGKYLRPEVVEALAFRAADPEDEEDLLEVVVTPTGLPDLASPGDMNLDDWRSLATGAFRLEEEVSQYIVEPMMRLIAPEIEISPQVKLPGAGIPDYVARQNDKDLCIIEVKLAIEVQKNQPPSQSRDLEQLRRYQGALPVPGLLIDTKTIVAVSAEGRPTAVFTRTDFSEEDADFLRNHILATTD